MKKIMITLMIILMAVSFSFTEEEKTEEPEYKYTTAIIYMRDNGSFEVEVLIDIKEDQIELNKVANALLVLGEKLRKQASGEKEL